MAKRGPENMFEMLKGRFPHLDLEIVNPQLTFSQNLKMIIGQLGLPQNTNITREITNMKDAVDSQELKIQKSLVNEEDVLGDIMNRGMMRAQKAQMHYQQRTYHKNHNYNEDSEPHENYWNHGDHHNPFAGNGHHEGMDMLSDIWEFGSQQNWFHH